MYTQEAIHPANTLRSRTIIHTELAWHQ